VADLLSGGRGNDSDIVFDAAGTVDNSEAGIGARSACSRQARGVSLRFGPYRFSFLS
jgi:hypothetical protein